VAVALNGQQVVLQLLSGGALVGPNPDASQAALATTTYGGGVAAFFGVVALGPGAHSVRVFDPFDNVFTDFSFFAA
jgi:hypothetical protein